MEPQLIEVPTNDGRVLKAYRFRGDVFALASDVDTAFGMSRPGMRGFLSKSKIGTVQIDELKQALELGGKVHFLNRVALEQLLRLRLSEPTQAIAMLTDDPTVNVAPQGSKPQQEALVATNVDACVLDNSIASDSQMVLDDETVASLLTGLLAEEPVDGPADSTVLVEKGDGSEMEQNLRLDGSNDARERSDAQAKDVMPPPPSELPPVPPLIPIAKMMPLSKHQPLRNRFLHAQIPSAQELEKDAVEMARRYTDSTVAKMDIVARAWNAIAVQQGWDVSSKHVSDDLILQFVHICLHKDYGVCYSLYSFRDSYVPALFRHFDREGLAYSDAIRDRVKHKVAAMVKNGDISADQIPKERGAEPICSWDLDYIAANYPKGCRDRVQVMAFLSTGLHTGLRGISLESMMWEDTRVATPGAGWLKQVTLVARETKGDRNWNHPVVIEGDVRDARGSNAVYWLAQLVKERLNDPAAELTQAFIGKLDGQVLAAADGTPLSKANLSSRITAVAVYCGYPEIFFSSHGLRSGFLCEALLKASTEGKEEVSISDVFLRCALAAGWTVNSRHMQSYVKQAFMRCLVSSRLIGGGTHAMSGDEEGSRIVAKIAGVGAVAMNRLNPLDFHGLTELVPCWPESCRIQLWTDALGGCVGDVLSRYRPELKGSRSVAASRNISRNLYIQLAVERDLLRANDDGGGSDDGGDGDEESSFEEMESRVPSFNAAREAVQVWVASRFDEHMDSWWLQEFISAQVKPAAVTLALAFEFDKDRSKSVRRGLRRKERAAKRVRDDNDGEGEKGPPPIPPPPVPVREKKRTKTMDNALHRIPWTAEETQALCQGVVEHGGAKWAVICKANALSRRSNVHCKDRMRTLMRQYDAKTLVAAAEQYLDENK